MDLAYCTNVVAGNTLRETRSNIERVFGAVRRLTQPNGAQPIGLWLSRHAATELMAQADGAARLREWLLERGLAVTTLNAFPYHGFHAPVVKHAVYEPSWADARRLLYTAELADMLPVLLPPGARRASISTLPVGWRPRLLAEGGGASVGVASAHLQQLVRHLARVEDRTGVRVHVDLEPEPGCLLDRARDVVAFYEQALSPRRGEPDPRRYVGVCHDVCHAAVMFENQRDVLDAYRSAGIRVGKVQVSSAPACTGAPDELAVLASLAEGRYLHQTCVRNGEVVRFYEDLPLALAEAPAGEWRTHFHVPVYAERLGAIATTQPAISQCINTVLSWPASEQPQFEVETYAWSVLPTDVADEARIEADTASVGHAGNTPVAADVADARLVRGIADELRWTARCIADARAAAAHDAQV